MRQGMFGQRSFTPTTWMMWLLSLAVAAVLLGGCGGSDDDDDGSESTDVSTDGSGSTSTSEPTSSSSATTSTTTSPTTSPETIEVFFGTGDPDVCEAVAPHERSVPAGEDPIRVAFDQLVRGPTAQEKAAGASSFFSSETEGSIRSATTVGGRLVVDVEDFRDVLTPAGANTSCGSGALLGELNATAFQFPAVDVVRYELEGSCDAFGEWLQRGCIEIDRADWEAGVAAQLPGRPVDGMLAPGAVLGVIGVAADDQLNVRALPGADQRIVARLDPLTTGLVFSGREREISAARSVWYEIDVDDVTGWVHSRFVAPLDGTFDVTSEIVAAAGEVPAGDTIEEIGAAVIEIRSRFADPKPSSIVVDGPTEGDLVEITYDLTGFGDDSVQGERLHLFAGDADGTGRLRLRSVEATLICARGPGGGSGLCP